MNLLGESHYAYNYLKARILILTYLNQAVLERPKRAENLFKGFQLEPNMISTYVLLSNHYRYINKPDSAIYYQEKVVELLPNQGYSYANLGSSYAGVNYIDANNQRIPHPKAIEYLEKAIEIEPTLQLPYFALQGIYMGSQQPGIDNSGLYRYRNYPKALPYVEKNALLYEASEQNLLKWGLNKYSQEMNSPNLKTNPFGQQIIYITILYGLYRELGNLAKSEEKIKQLHQKITSVGSIYFFTLAALDMWSNLYYWENDDIYLTNTLDLLQRSLEMANEGMGLVSAENKPLLTLQYQEILKGIGAVHRALRNYSEAEIFLQQALTYPVFIPSNGRLEWSSSFLSYQNRIIVAPSGISFFNGSYRYGVDTTTELFFLKLEQDKPNEALVWLEKALKGLKSKGEKEFFDKELSELVFKNYKNLNKEAYQALLDKYFPPTPNEKK